jgi:DNA-binding CsgD family transcriptional regulator
VELGDAGAGFGGERSVAERFDPHDPARPIVAAIVDLVPVSEWAFADLADGALERFVSSSPMLDLAWWKRSAPVRERPHAGYRITPILHGLGRYGSGLSLTFADSRTDFGVLTLLRTNELGPFTSGEIRLLVFALDWASERLSTRRLMEAHELAEERAEREHLEELKDARDDASALYVLDQEYAIALAWSAVPDETAAVAASETRLPHRIEQSVRQLTRGWTTDPATRKTGVARPTPFLVVLTQPLVGPNGFFIGVVIQLFKQPHSLTAAAAQFAMSPREAQVLALLLDGAQIPEVGERLSITASTVQDHIKSLLHKTSSKNRSQMIAKVLGWGRS